jgi:hypothetical protein
MADIDVNRCGRPHGDAKLVLCPPQGGWIRGLAVRFAAKISMLSAMPALVLGLGACAMPDTDSFRAPDASALFRPMSVTNYKDRILPPVAAADLVDAGGGCADAVAPATASGEGVPMVPAAIALEMTECDVVKRAGPAERVELSTNERRERTATLTYVNGQRPGIYYFTAGRLTSMERAPEPPPAPAKPAKRPAPAKRVAKPNQVSVQ